MDLLREHLKAFLHQVERLLSRAELGRPLGPPVAGGNRQLETPDLYPFAELDGHNPRSNPTSLFRFIPLRASIRPTIMLGG